jgi:hypothetical protein
MSGSEEKFDFIEEARVKYGRLNKLFRRMREKPTLPSELATALKDYEQQGAVSNSIKFIDALRKSYSEVRAPEEFKAELQRIATWSRWSDFDASEEEKAQLSADRIHLSCARFGNHISG